MDEAWTLQDLIGLLPQRVLDPVDFIRCSAVCEVWRFSFKEYKSQPQPWLMSAETKDSDVRDFFNPSNGNTFSLSLPEVYGRFFFSTNYGWLLTLGLDLAINLLHPLSRIQIPLPSADMFPYKNMIHKKEWMRWLFLEKVCLSSDPREKNCIIMVTYSDVENLAFVRLGDSCWTHVELPLPGYDDLMFFKRKFYAIRQNGFMVACDIDLPEPNGTVTVTQFPPSNGPKQVPFHVYLVESSGNILAVVRHLDYVWEKVSYKIDCKSRLPELLDYHTTNFEVFRMEKGLEKEEMKWSRVTDLGDCGLFVGRNSSMSISTKNCRGIRKNCIYFTDDATLFQKTKYLPEIGYDIGIFCLSNQKIERCHNFQSYCPFSAPGWVPFSSFVLR